MRPKINFDPIYRHDISFFDRTLSVGSKQDIGQVLKMLVKTRRLSQEEFENISEIKSYPAPMKETCNGETERVSETEE